MGFSLKNLVQGAGNAVGNIAHGVQNDLNNVQRGASYVAGSVLPHSAPSTPSSPNGPLSSQVASFPNVWGTLVAQHVADEQGYSPMFRNIVQEANPTVDNAAAHEGMNASAGGVYSPATNQIHLNSNQLDPYTVTHEGLHAAFQRKTPQAQADFAKVAAQATPIQRRFLTSKIQLGSPIYRGQTPLTEVHSFLPQSDFNGSSPTNQYYKNYFSNPNFYQENQTVGVLQDLLAARSPQFSDWED